MYYFIAVNYGTSNIIEQWINSIDSSYKGKKEIIIVDNFKSTKERKDMIYLSKKFNFLLIESDNIGYGAALNKALRYAKKNFNISSHDIFLIGNLDIIYQQIPHNLSQGKYVYISKALENQKNKNPFLTKIQSKFLFLHKISVITNSIFVLYVVVVVLKLIGYIRSKTWTLHGSLFTFNASLLSDKMDIFNNKSFLYSEELEFGSYMEYQNAIFMETDITYKHIAHVATKKLFETQTKFLDIWKSSFKNWANRWAI